MNRIGMQFARGLWVGGTLGFSGSSLAIAQRRTQASPLEQRDLIEKYTIMGVGMGAIAVCFSNWAPQTMLIVSAAFVPNYIKLRNL